MRFARWLVAGIMMVSTAAAVTPELVVQNRVASGVVAISPDGRVLAAAGGLSGAAVLQLWDLSTGKLFKEVATRGGDHVALAFLRGGKAVATCCKDGGAEVWDTVSGERMRIVTSASCAALAASPDGRFLAINREENTQQGRRTFVQMVDAEDGRVIRKFESPQPLSIAFSPDGRSLIAGGFDQAVRVWDVGTGALRFSLGGHERYVQQASVSADGALAATYDGAALRIWSMSTGAEVRVEKQKHAQTRFGPSGRLLFVASRDGAVDGSLRLVDGETGTTVRELRGPYVFAKSAAFGGAGGNLLAVAGTVSGRGMAGGVQLWNTQTGRLIRELRSDVTAVSHAAFSGSGRLLAVIGENGARVWDLATLRPVPVAYPETTECNTADGIQFTPRDDALVIAVACGRIDVVSLGREPLRVLRPPSRAFVHSFAVSPDGTTVVGNVPSCMGQGDDCSKGYVAWDLPSGKVLWTYPTEGFLSGSKPAISADGRTVAVVDKQLVVVDARSGSVLSRREFQYTEGVPMVAEPRSVAIASDGRFAVGLSFNNLRELKGAARGGETRLTRSSLGSSDSSLDIINAVQYSPDGKLLVAARYDGVLVFVRNGAVREVRAHAGIINSIAFSPDGKLLATVGQDSAVRIWDSEAASLVTTLVQVGENDYVFASPEGAYTASPGALSGVAFRAGARAYPIEQFDLTLNRPDVVLNRLGTGSRAQVAAYRRAWLARLNRMGMDEAVLSAEFHAPSVDIVNRETVAVSTRANVVQLLVRATDDHVPLERLQVVVNDVPLWGARGRALPKRKGTVDVPVQVELSAGINRIRVSAVNSEAAESPGEVLEIVSERHADEVDTYVVVVGVSQYRDSRFGLEYAAKDATDVANLFQASGNPSRVRTLRILDEQATRERIVAAKEFLEGARVDDRVVVFVAGHGVLDDTFQYYFGTVDMDFDAPAKRGLPFHALEDLLDGIASRRKLLLIDTCHSGELDERSLALGEVQSAEEGSVRARAVRGVRVKNAGLGADGSAQLLGELFRDLRRGSGASIISSAGGAEFALESERWRNGVFTYSLLKGLRSGAADTDHDSRVSVSELREYVVATVQNLTGGAQRPTSRRESAAFDFEIYTDNISSGELAGVAWDNPELCATVVDKAQCECLMREASTRFPHPRAFIEAIRRHTHATKHGLAPPPESAAMRQAMQVCIEEGYARKPTEHARQGADCPEGMALLVNGIGPTEAARLKPFCIDRTEVTVREYMRCSAAGACLSANARCDPFANLGVPGRLDHPMNCVSWADADEYCAWAGKRLPSQFEWAWAGHGGERNTTYPWGSGPPTRDVCWRRGEGPQASWLGTCPAGVSKDDVTPQGVHDMGANVGEWSATAGPDGTRIIMGGGWADDDKDTGMSAEWSMPFDASRRHSVLGFRCARTVEGSEARAASAQ